MTAPLSPQDALATQRRIAARVERDRRRASSAAVPLGLFGACSLVAAAIASTGDWVALAVFWSIAGPVGGLGLAWWFRRQDLRLPFQGPPTAVMVATAITMVAGALVLGWSGSGNVAFFAVGCGYVLFAAASGNATTFRVAVAIIAFTWLAQLDDWAGLTSLSAVARTVLLTSAVGAAQLLGAAAELRRVGRGASTPA